MTWRDQLRPATLAGVAFFVDSTEAQLGRNVQVHEYPLRDLPYVEDLGRKARRFTLDAYVIGPDYMPARDALIAVLESAGNKLLVHPYIGELTVNVVECNGPRESTREGGMARFSITVVESGEHVFPSSTADTQALVIEKIDALMDANLASFASNFETAAAPSFVQDSAAAQVRALADQLTTLASYATTLPDQMNDFVAAVSELSGAASSLILVPQTLASKVQAIFAQLQTIVSQPMAAMNIVRSLFNFGADFAAVPIGTASREQQYQNQAAYIQLVQLAAVATAAQLASTIDYDTAEASLAIRDELIDVIDYQSERVDTDALYYTLVDVRTAVVTDLETRSAQLSRLFTVTLKESTCAIALAYDLYEDATRDIDIIARNGVRDPNFLPSGRALTVLSNG